MPLDRASISGRARRFDTRCSRIGVEESQAGPRICFAFTTTVERVRHTASEREG